MAETSVTETPLEHPVITVLRGFCAEYQTRYAIDVPDLRPSRGVATDGKHLLVYYPDDASGDTPLPDEPSPYFPPAWEDLISAAEARPVLARGTLAELRAILRGPSSPIKFQRVPRSCRMCARAPERYTERYTEKRCDACHQLIPCERCGDTCDDPEDRRLSADPEFVDLVAPAGDRPLSIAALCVRTGPPSPPVRSLLGARTGEDVFRCDPVLLVYGVEGLQQIEGRNAEVVVHLTPLAPMGCGDAGAQLLLVTRRARYLLMGVAVLLDPPDRPAEVAPAHTTTATVAPAEPPPSPPPAEPAASDGSCVSCGDTCGGVGMPRSLADSADPRDVATVEQLRRYPAAARCTCLVCDLRRWRSALTALAIQQPAVRTHVLRVVWTDIAASLAERNPEGIAAEISDALSAASVVIGLDAKASAGDLERAYSAFEDLLEIEGVERRAGPLDPEERCPLADARDAEQEAAREAARAAAR